MSIGRVSTYSNHLITLDSLQRRQGSLNETQKQVTSGFKYDNFADIAAAGQTRRVIDFQSSLTRIDNYGQVNEIVANRLETMDKAVSTIEDITNDAITAMMTERSAAGDALPLSTQLKQMLGQIADRLNANAGGRYLFAGAAVTTRPVGDLEISNVDSAGNFTDNYYAGDNAALPHAVSDEVNIDYAIRANDPAFQKLIGAFHLAIRAEANGSDTELANAIELANEARVEVAGVRNTIRNNSAIIETTNKQHDDFKTYYNQTLSTLEGTDVAAASISLSMDQAILQASFQTFARISGLALTNYLK